jgi:hypothetical protein
MSRKLHLHEIDIHLELLKSLNNKNKRKYINKTTNKERKYWLSQLIKNN